MIIFQLSEFFTFKFNWVLNYNRKTDSLFPTIFNISWTWTCSHDPSSPNGVSQTSNRLSLNSVVWKAQTYFWIPLTTWVQETDVFTIPIAQPLIFFEWSAHIMLHKEILLDVPEIAKTKLPFLQKNTTAFQSYCQEYDYISGSNFKVDFFSCSSSDHSLKS